MLLLERESGGHRLQGSVSDILDACSWPEGMLCSPASWFAVFWLYDLSVFISFSGP